MPHVRFIHYTFPYAHWSAGLRVVHYYCHLMRKAGFDSYITTKGNPEWDTPIFSGDVLDSDIVIYPEPSPRSVSNPFNAKNVVRYFLYFPNVAPYNKIGIVPANEYCQPFIKDYFDACAKAYALPLSPDNILCIPAIDTILFHARDSKTIDNVFFIGKGSMLTPSPHLPANSVQITYGFPDSREGTAKLLRSAKNFYSFDRYTALNVEAQLCGCRTYLLNKDAQPIEHKDEISSIMDYNKDIVNVKAAADRILKFFGLEGAI